MTDICIPISHLRNNEDAEIFVSFGGVKKKYNYKVEAFPWNPEEKTEQRITLLKRLIENYDKNWELVQIYNPGTKDAFIHVLLRMKN